MKKTWLTSAHRGFCLPGMCENTLSAIRLAAEKGADMIETDARTSSDGVIFVNHDKEAVGFDENGNKISLIVSETNSSELKKLVLCPDDPDGTQYLPTLAEVLHLVYFYGLRVNIDLKEGEKHAEDVAKLVLEHGLRGRAVYATNGSGADTVNKILAIDPEAKFIDKPCNFTAEKLASVMDFRSKCYAYTSDFSEDNIKMIRDSGCMLAAISLYKENINKAFSLHPDMAEYLHTSDFVELENSLIF